MAAVPKYDEKSIRVLKGLEPVRSRPGMYTRTESPLHIIQEVIDNAVDEALGGYARSISVTMHVDGGITVEDDGRGIPVGMHPIEKIPTVALVFTQLHAGGKFDKAAGGAYSFSGGLHGVGVAVTTALSKRVVVEIRREGKRFGIEFSDNGRVTGGLQKLGPNDDGKTGTRVTVYPDPQYFDSPSISVPELIWLLRSKAVLLASLTVTLHVESPSPELATTTTWCYPRGLAGYLEELADGRTPIAPVYVAERYITEGEDSEFAVGEGAAFAFGWYQESISAQSFVNLIPTISGGTHESGLCAGIYEAIKSFVEHHSLLPRGVRIQQDDVKNRLSYLISARVLDPAFEGQVKSKLSSRSANKLCALAVRSGFETWLNANVDSGRAIADLVIKAALARQNNAKSFEKRRSSSVTVLPGKLADCEATTDNELFLVEGDSAGGSAKEARNRVNQAILPLRGKVLNTLEVEAGQLFRNREVHDISVALGVEPHKADRADDASVLSGMRYTRLMIMTDADVDGAHIRTLLLTLFYKHFPAVVRQGRVFVVESPLFRIDVPAWGAGKPARRFYALDQAEREVIEEKLRREGVRPDRVEVGRFKGLGEMDARQLSEVSMHPATRRVVPVRYKIEHVERIDMMFDHLMSEGNAEWRREWMTANGASADADI
jgi:topoisomerase-4 subunit B